MAVTKKVARDEAVERFLLNEALATFIARRYRTDRTAYLWEDLLSTARLGLWKACLTYNEARGTQFSTYAAKCIENEINLFLRRESRAVPTVSFNEIGPVDDEGTASEALTLESRLGSEDPTQVQMAVNTIINELKSCPILTTCVLEGKTQREVAASLERSQASISRQVSRERRKLRRRLEKLGILS